MDIMENLSSRKDQVTTKGSVKSKKQIQSVHPYLAKPKVKRIHKEKKQKNTTPHAFQTSIAKRWKLS
jgi:hypothetical protein